ncbi:hypothetical protein GOODEAATRI_014739, partial [Goodea atripinnis]
YKEVVKGYKKNEKTLKACAQDYLTNKGEQHYQMLKAKSEEKINLANEEIAGLRSKKEGGAFDSSSPAEMGAAEDSVIKEEPGSGGKRDGRVYQGMSLYPMSRKD